MTTGNRLALGLLALLPAMLAQAEFYHRQGGDTILLDHGARWSVNGWGLQAVTPDDIARLRAEDEL